MSHGEVIDRVLTWLVVVVLISVPLSMWKIVDIIIWFLEYYSEKTN